MYLKFLIFLCFTWAHCRTLVAQPVDFLQTMFADLVAGDTLLLSPGEYSAPLKTSLDPGNLPNGKGYYWIGNDGSQANPIVISALNPAMPPHIKGESIAEGYVFHITGDYVYLKNLIISTGDKGVVFDNANFGILEGNEIFNTGAEIVHIRDGSSNVILNKNKIWGSGNGGNGSIGEGLYIGTDQARWGSDDFPQSAWGDKAISEGYGGYDWRVHNTQVLCNYFSGGISAEILDIKEGTIGTILKGNVFVGDSIGLKPGAANYDDSFIDVKGVEVNATENSFFSNQTRTLGYINEVDRSSYPHVPANLTTDGHSKPWCDENDNDLNNCSAEQNYIITEPFDPRQQCPDLISNPNATTPIYELKNSIHSQKKTHLYNAKGRQIIRKKLFYLREYSF